MVEALTRADFQILQILSQCLDQLLGVRSHPLELDSEIHFQINDNEQSIYLRPDCCTAQELERLFELPDRWNGEMYNSIKRCGFKTLEYIIRGHLQFNKKINRNQIISEGENAIKREWGSTSYAYVATRWISEIAPQTWESIISGMR